MKTFSLLITLATCSASAQLSKIQIEVTDNHPRVLAAIQRAAALKAQGDRVNAAYRPTLSFTAVGAVGDDASIFAMPMDPKNYLFAPHDPIAIGSFMAMVPVFTAGRNAAAAKYARFLSGAGKAEVDVARADVLRDARIAFAELEAARGRLAAETSGYSAAQELLKVTEARFSAGSVPEAFVL